MVGDIIQNPLGNFISGALAAGAWTVNQVWQTQYDTFQRTSGFAEQFLNGFTADDLVDIPPPPAEDLGSVKPEGKSAGKTVTGAPDDYSWNDFVKDSYVQEQKRGIQSPLGPEDPSGVLAPVPEQQRPKDPQAPLKPAFAPSPNPGSRQTAGSNQILKKVGSDAGTHNAGTTPGSEIWPIFRGKSGSKKNIEVQYVNIFAVPTYTDDGVTWQAQIQTLKGSRVTATWVMDAGTRAPSGGEFKLMYKHTKQSAGPVDVLAYNFPSLGIKTTIFPLTESTAPELIEPPSWSIDLDPWQTVPDLTYPPGTQPLENGLIVFPTPSPETPQENPIPIPPIPFPINPPVRPDTAVPLNPNNPIDQPAVGTNGLLQPIARLQKTTSSNAHKIGQLLVNSGGMRNDITAVAKEVGRIEQKTANISNGINPLLSLIPDLLFALSLLVPPQKTPAKELSMNAFCDKTEEGEPLTMSIAYPEAEMLPAIISRLDDIPAWLEQQLAWKTPTCDEQPTTEGDFRTINFRSASPSPYSSSRLRKRFRYRSTSGLGLGEVVDHWKDFTFQSGPCRVRHVGSAWGSPEVWAATEDEGKRVIRHAAGEAGIDPDQVGRWSTRSSDSSRLGVSDAMSVDTLGGFYRITSRDGSDGRPIVAKDIDY